MTAIVELEIGDDIIKVEVDPPTKSGEVQAATADEIAQRVRNSFDQALSIIQVSAERIISTINKLSETPSECEVEFGIKIDGEVGAVVARVHTGAHYVVKLKWKQSEERHATKT